MKLAGALAFSPIAVPVWFMGLPIPQSEDEITQLLLDEIMERFATQMEQMHIECHRDGTLWVWPFFSATDGKIHWEIIPDGSVTDIIRSIETGVIIKIVTKNSVSEQQNGRNRRVFTLVRLLRWGASINLKSGTKMRRTPFHLRTTQMPTRRGHSDYERIVYDLKDYNDIDRDYNAPSSTPSLLSR